MDQFPSQQKTLLPFLTKSEQLDSIQYLSSPILLCLLQNHRMLGPEKALEDIKFICSLIHKHTLRAYYVLGTILADTDVRVHKTRHSP